MTKSIKQSIRETFYLGGDEPDWPFVVLMTILGVIGLSMILVLVGLVVLACWASPYHWAVIPTVAIPYSVYKFWAWVLKDN